MCEEVYSPSESKVQEEPTGFRRFLASVPAFTDAELVRRASGDFDAAFWHRFYVLAAKLEAETMTHREQQEFLTYTDRTEAWSAERLAYLVELAKRRGVTVIDLIKQYNLRTGASA
jgi:hypothetical protein